MLDLVFSNNEPPALNATNLNYIVEEINNKTDSAAIEEEITRIDNEVDTINETLSTKAKQSDVDAINNDLHDLSYGESAGGKNLVDTSKATKGRWLDSSGNLNIISGNNVTDYIEVSGNVVLSGLVGNNASYCWYDANKAYISGVAYSGNPTKAAIKPANAKYIRASFLDTNVNSFMIEYGTTATDYEPYIASNKMLTDNVTSLKETKELPSDVNNLTFKKSGNTVSVYGFLNLDSSKTQQIIGDINADLRPANDYAILNLMNDVSPYQPIGSMWIFANGNVTVYKPQNTAKAYAFGSYITN